MNGVIVLGVEALVLLLASGLFYTLVYMNDNSPKRMDAMPIVPPFIITLYGLALFGLYSMYISRKKKKPYNIILLVMGCAAVFLAYGMLEVLYRQMYARR